MGARYKRNFIQRWIYICVCILILSTSISYLASKYILEKIYESSSTLIVHGYDLGEGNKALRDTRIYRTIATSNQMMGEIIGRLDLQWEIKDLRSKVTVSYEEDTGLIYLTVEDKDPEIAFKIAESMIFGLQKRVEELFGRNYLKIVDEPYIPFEPSRPSVALNVVIAAILAMILSALIIVWDIKRR